MRRREKRRFYEDRIEDAICFSFNGMSRRRPLIRGEETVDLWGGWGGIGSLLRGSRHFPVLFPEYADRGI